MEELLQSSDGESNLILVVDDDWLIRKAIVDILSLSGYQTVEAENGREALRIYKSVKPVLVLMDLVMPEMDGFAACRQLRLRVPDLALPIIVLTSLDDMGVIDRAFDAGATDFMAKPFNPRLLAVRVRYALRNRAVYMNLKEQQRRLAYTQRIAKIGYGQLNLTTGMLNLTDEGAEVLGLPKGSRSEQFETLSNMMSHEDRRHMLEEIQRALEGDGHYSFEHRVTMPDRGEKVLMQRGEVKRIEGEVLVSGTLQDVTEQVVAEERVRYHTYYDALTSLPNRLFFENHLHERLESETRIAVMFVGIDRFKGINDAMGHAFGDELLRQVAGRLALIQDYSTMLSRFGGDLFVMAISRFNKVHKVSEFADRVMRCFEAPIHLNGLELRVSASLGIALFPEEADTVDKLILGADTAMNQAKKEGGAQYRYFTKAMDAKAQQRLALEHDLQVAVRRGEFEVYYQPQLDVVTNRVVGMEALLRWNHPERGVVLPGAFIPMAEETGIINEIGEWVLLSACRQTQKWVENGFGRLRVGVNLSARQLEQVDFSHTVLNALDKSGLDPTLLEIEITESIAVSNFDNTSRILQQIRSHGVNTSMDDFGIGYSALSYLQNLPLDTLKVDRAFVKGIDANGEHGELAKAIIAMAHSVGLHVIAEGIETKYQMDYLIQQHCNEVQGNYISRPLPYRQFEGFMNKMNSQAGPTLTLIK